MKNKYKIIAILLFAITQSFSQKNKSFFYLQKSDLEKYAIHYFDYDLNEPKTLVPIKESFEYSYEAAHEKPQLFTLVSDISSISFIVFPQDTIYVRLDENKEIKISSSRRKCFDYVQTWLQKHNINLSSPPKQNTGFFISANSYDNIKTYQSLLDSLRNDIKSLPENEYYFHFEKEVKYYYLMELLGTFNNQGVRKGRFADSLVIDPRTTNFIKNLKPEIDADTTYCLQSVYWFYLVSWNDFMCKYYYKTGFTIKDFFKCGLKNLEGTVREDVLYNYLRFNFKTNKWSSDSDIDYLQMTEEFKDICSNKAYLMGLAEMSAGLSNSTNNSKSLDPLLLTDNKSSIKWSDFLKRNSGKVIYIDFWASWCAPCRQEMPFSFSLQKELKNQPINFAYVSIDAEFKSWQAGVKVFGLSVYDSYLSNIESNGLSKFFNVESIPRYILIDKYGRIVTTNAPRPSDPKLKDLINKYLN